MWESAFIRHHATKLLTTFVRGLKATATVMRSRATEKSVLYERRERGARKHGALRALVQETQARRDERPGFGEAIALALR